MDYTHKPFLQHFPPFKLRLHSPKSYQPSFVNTPPPLSQPVTAIVNIVKVASIHKNCLLEVTHFHWPLGFLVLMLPHHPIQTHLLTALSNHPANVVGGGYIVGLVQMPGSVKFFHGCLHDTEAIVVSDVG